MFEHWAMYLLKSSKCLCVLAGYFWVWKPWWWISGHNIGNFSEDVCMPRATCSKCMWHHALDACSVCNSFPRLFLEERTTCWEAGGCLTRPGQVAVCTCIDYSAGSWLSKTSTTFLRSLANHFKDRACGRLDRKHTTNDEKTKRQANGFSPQVFDLSSPLLCYLLNRSTCHNETI